MIKIENLSKDFGNTKAVVDLNLEIKKGEFFAFLGPNGAGKTTTIKLMTGLLKPSQGRVLIGGHDMKDSGFLAKRIIGYIPEYPYLYERLTAREFVEFILEVYGSYAVSLESKIQEMFELFGLGAYQDTLIQDYSHGMRQRLIYISCLIHEPEVLIIDEPLVALDPQASRLVKDILKKRSEAGATIFMSTHILSVAEELADRIGIIDSGKLIALGSLNELKKLTGTNKGLEEAFLRLTEDDSGRLIR
ncbi:MAG: ABC transporter ATP-binding protein [Candidatus Omnitrophota bacterium]